jgi:hypothetical protein
LTATLRDRAISSLNTLMKRKTRETPNPKRSPEIPDERKHSLQRFANLTGKGPLRRLESSGEEVRRGGGEN